MPFPTQNRGQNSWLLNVALGVRVMQWREIQ